MNPSRIFLSLLLVGAATAQAQTVQKPRVVRPFLNLGLTAGGDKMASLTYTDGSTSSIKAGGQVLIKVGLDIQVVKAFSLQASYGRHTASTKESTNGGVDFKRNPFEALAYWHPGGHSRLGLGFRKVSNAELTSDGAASMGTVKFSASTGTVFEWEYVSGPLTSFGSRAGFSLRYVNEKYTPTSWSGIPVTGDSVDGSHFGLGLAWYF